MGGSGILTVDLFSVEIYIYIAALKTSTQILFNVFRRESNVCFPTALS